MTASETMGAAVAQMQRFGALAVELAMPPGEHRFGLAQRGAEHWMVDNRPAPNTFPQLSESAFARLV